MSSKTQFISAFYNQLDDFMNKLSEQFPEEKDIKIYQKSMHLIRAGNETMFIRKFYTYVSPYKQEIDEYNQDFFLSMDYERFGSETTLMEALKISKIWKSGRLSEASKKATFQYFQILLKLCERIL
jgi:hypothetical protein